ncbi:hypothetical protein FJY93_01105 [Candidatus Kaiserbacteria bacterium]|nr:hypothetical protein [Candidatus Kaiserbacteria bacterium]
MDRVEKFIRKVGKDRAPSVRAIIARIVVNDLAGLDVRKLKGKDFEYRIRVGRIRIKFVRSALGNNEVIDITFRDNNT